jgi:hypothetical protein
MEATRYSETSIYNKPTCRHIPEYGIPHSHRRGNLKSYIIITTSGKEIDNALRIHLQFHCLSQALAYLRSLELQWILHRKWTLILYYNFWQVDNQSIWKGNLRMYATVINYYFHSLFHNLHYNSSNPIYQSADVLGWIMETFSQFKRVIHNSFKCKGMF